MINKEADKGKGLSSWEAYFNRDEFVKNLQKVVIEGNLEVFKDFIYNLREIGGHASISPAEQIYDFNSWLKEIDGDGSLSEKYMNMTAELLRPENLPDFEVNKSFSEVDINEKRNREVFKALLFGNGFFRQTFSFREKMMETALSLLESDKSDVDLASQRADLAQYMTVSLIINNQTDRRLENIWRAVLTGEEIEPKNEAERKLLKQSLYLGFDGLMKMPTKGDYGEIPWDIAPGALKDFVKELDRRGSSKEKEQFGIALWGNFRRDQAGFLKLLDLVGYKGWPKWAVKEMSEVIKKYLD